MWNIRFQGRSCVSASLTVPSAQATRCEWFSLLTDVGQRKDTKHESSQDEGTGAATAQEETPPGVEALLCPQHDPPAAGPVLSDGSGSGVCLAVCLGSSWLCVLVVRVKDDYSVRDGSVALSTERRPGGTPE